MPKTISTMRASNSLVRHLGGYLGSCWWFGFCCWSGRRDCVYFSQRDHSPAASLTRENCGCLAGVSLPIRAHALQTNGSYRRTPCHTERTMITRGLLARNTWRKKFIVIIYVILSKWLKLSNNYVTAVLVWNQQWTGKSQSVLPVVCCHGCTCLHCTCLETCMMHHIRHTLTICIYIECIIEMHIICTLTQLT